jgi:hypothetical protein
MSQAETGKDKALQQIVNFLATEGFHLHPAAAKIDKKEQLALALTAALQQIVRDCLKIIDKNPEKVAGKVIEGLEEFRLQYLDLSAATDGQRAKDVKEIGIGLGGNPMLKKDQRKLLDKLRRKKEEPDSNEVS